MNRLFALLYCLSFCLTLSAQLTGTIQDTDGLPLSYVNIYITGTSIGTTSNEEGIYILEATEGQYEISYQYIGFKTHKENINLSKKSQTIDITLYPEEYSLDQVTISANAEDPAYAIIRKAQKKRKEYKKKLSNKECDAYVKGFNKITESPDKIMGMDIGDLKKTLDEDGSGVVYLSESISKLYQKNNKIKEVMYSSKVSGDDQGYSFNSAKEMNFDFYENTINLNRDLVTPIAKNALTHYNYKLEGAYYQGNQLVNKIKVIPKNEYGNSFYGHIYINENLWNINSLELSVTKHTTQLPFIDTLTFNQVFAEIANDTWAPLSNVISFKMGALGFKVIGKFVGVYSNYKLGTVSDDIFNNEVYRVLEGSNERSQIYWDTLRPIPLSKEQTLDYHRKDSIKILKESPAYLDSIDNEVNQFSFGDILTNYSHQNSRKKFSYTISSPLFNTSVNTIQGWNSAIKFSSTKHLNKLKTKRLSIGGEVNYGFSEKTIRPNLRVAYRANRINNATLRIEGGKKLSQYNRQDPISNVYNSIYTLFLRQNYLKAYDKVYGAIAYSQQLGKGVKGGLSLNYEDRTAVVNNYNGGFNQDDRNFTSNNPQNVIDDQPAFEPHQALILRAHLVLNIGQEIWTYPHRVYRENGNWPTIGLYYKGGIRTLGADTDYHILYSTITKDINLKIYGNSEIFLMGGRFLGDRPRYFVDQLHFIGTQTHLANPAEYSRRFLMLPYYSNSSGEQFIQAHLQHNFQGFLLSKVPLLKRTGWSLVGGYKILASSDNETYDEITLGIDNIGIKLAKIFRVDLVWHKQHCGESINCNTNRKLALVVGLKVNI